MNSNILADGISVCLVEQMALVATMLAHQTHIPEPLGTVYIKVKECGDSYRVIWLLHKKCIYRTLTRRQTSNMVDPRNSILKRVIKSLAA